VYRAAVRAVPAVGGRRMTVPWGIAVTVTTTSGSRRRRAAPSSTGCSGVQIDASGNVWLTNNGKTAPEGRNQYGDGLVVFLGAAAHIALPRVGTPRQP
jgi:hypothetical protein